MQTATPLIISLEGGYNFRDLGGYPAYEGRQTRYGLVYRSGGLHKLTEAGRAELNRLGIRASFDLREAYEVESNGVDACGAGVQVIAAPTGLDVKTMVETIKTNPLSFRMADFYLSSFDPRVEYHGALFRQILANLNAPLVFHCSAGKDRTGIVAALLLRVVGVPDDIIIQDYALTAQHLGVYLEEQQAHYRSLGAPQAVIDEILGSPAENIARLLRYLDEKWGSAEAYLQAGGVTESELETFRQQFTQRRE